MSLGEIADVDVIANAGAVFGGVVLAEDLDVRPTSESNIEDEGNQMRTRAHGASPYPSMAPATLK